MTNFFILRFPDRCGLLLKKVIPPVIFLFLSLMLVLALNQRENKSFKTISPKAAPSTLALNFSDFDTISIKTKKEEISLSKKTDRWHVDTHNFPAREGLINTLLYNINHLTVSQRLENDSSSLLEMGLSMEEPTEDTVVVSLHSSEQILMKIIFGKIFHPQIGENAQNQWLQGKNENSYRAVAVIDKKGQINTFLTPANGARVETHPNKWLSQLAVPWSDMILSTSFQLSDETTKTFHRKKALGAFRNKENGQKIPDKYTIILSNMLNPGLCKLYETIPENQNVIESAKDKTLIEIKTSRGLQYIVKIITNYNFDKNALEPSNKGKTPVIQVLSVDKNIPDRFGLASFSIKPIKPEKGKPTISADEIDEINKTNKNRTFVVGADEISEIIKFIRHENNK